MEKVLKFNYDDPEDLRKAKIYEASEDLLYALQDMAEWLRARCDSDNTPDDSKREVFDRVRDVFWQTMEDHDVKGLLY